MPSADFLTPISEASPSGPDLDEEGDDQFLNYMMRAENQLPTRYLDFSEDIDGVPFDAGKIDLKGELKAIAELMQRTRDLRLLTLEARFLALSGQFSGYADCVRVAAGLLDTMWEEVHPRAYEGDLTLRQNTVSSLGDKTTVVAALEYAPLINDKRYGNLMLRDLSVARGTAKPRDGERAIDMAGITEALGAERNKGAVDAVHAKVVACKQDLVTIQNLFDERTDYQFSPDFDQLSGVFDQMLGMIAIGRPDLGKPPVDEVEVATTDEAEGEAGESALDDGAPARPVARPGVVSVTSHAAAKAALLTAERYFGRNEPSSPALLLVHQSRMLVGQPLVVALEHLIPDRADSAVLTVDTNFGFEFSMAKMKALMEDYASAYEESDSSEEEIPEYVADTRVQATAIIFGVAAFFKATEPSSPIPLLLGRAEKFLNQNFTTILADIMAKSTAE